jgi:hypothetical protein
MNSKKLITLLVLTTMLIGLVPVMPVRGAILDADVIDVENDDKAVWSADAVGTGNVPKGEKGHDIYVFGPADQVASGYEVMIYWDKIQDWDGEQGHLNTTDVDSDGGFEIWFDVPEAEAGNHYVWITATDQETKVSFKFEVVPDCDLESSSGLIGDRVYVDFWGFDNNEDIGILFVADDAGDPPHQSLWNTASKGPETLDTGDGEETEFDDTVTEGMIKPGSFVITLLDDYGAGAGALAADNGHHKIIDTVNDVRNVEGNIDYITGEWDIEFDTTSPNVTLADGWRMIVTYEVWDELEDNTYILASNGQTDALGSWENRRINIPDDADEGLYYVFGIDGDNHTAYDDFTIGAVISLETDIAPVGEVVEVKGEGFDYPEDFRVYMTKGSKEWECHVIGADDATPANTTDDDGEFRVEVVIPQVKDEDDDYELEVRGDFNTVSEDFEITDLAEVSVDPDFGPQGSRITVSGENFAQSSDAEITIELWDSDGATRIVGIEEEVELDSDGSFEETTRVPTETDGEYKIKAFVTADDDGGFNIADTVSFRIGTMLVLLSEDSGVTGEKIILTGSGFSKNGEWNATIGGITIFEDAETNIDGILKENDETPAFLVPQLEPGIYTITVFDVDEEISVDVDFEVEESVYLELSTYTAPNKYNLTINGWNWPEVDGEENTVDEIEWVIYNETDDWDMDVRMHHPTNPTGDVVAYLNGSGFYNDAWWIVLEDDDLDLGVYTINATIETTSDLEYTAQFEFTVGEVHESISPRKATFRLGDTVSFKVQHSFGGQSSEDIAAGSIKVYDPDGSLYWAADEYDYKDWVEVAMWWELPYSEQNDGGNPMVLLDDAPLGTWTYEWLDDDDDLIKEGTFNVEAAAEEVIGQQIEDLNTAIDDLTSDISSVTDAVAGVQSDVNSAIAAANAAVEAANAAVDAVNSVAGTASEAAEAAQNAADAAESAQNAASGLTTLVYGAIGASLVAALAAIVSLMQISRRIAG